MTPHLKRQLFPLRGPRYQTLCWWPVAVLAAAIDGYHEACMAVYYPRGRS